MMHFTDGIWYAGTGSLINNQQVLTCAHNLIEETGAHRADEVRFYPGWSQNVRPVVTGGGQTPSSAAVYAFYATQFANQNDAWDIGVINLAVPVQVVPPNYYFQMQTVINTNLGEHELWITGYPGNHPGEMRAERASVEGISLQHNTLSHLHDTWEGSSGSPVYEYDTEADIIRLYGVHVEGPNQLRRATLLTPAIRNLLNNAVYHPALGAGFQLHGL